MKTILVFILAVGLHAPASAQNRYIEDDRNPNGGAVSSVSWPGGPHSLPLGSCPPPAAIQTALAMEPMKVAMRTFESRGYIRRADQDAAFVKDGFAVVAICWEKPGVSTESRQPTILAATKFMGGYYVTQVYGGVVGSDDGVTLRTYDDPSDPHFVLAGTRSGAGSGRGSLFPEAGGTTPGEIAGFASAYDAAGWTIAGADLWSYAIYEGTGYPVDVWQQYGRAIGQPMIIGGLGGWSRSYTWQGAAWGAVCGWALANNSFWANHP